MRNDKLACSRVFWALWAIGVGMAGIGYVAHEASAEMPWWESYPLLIETPVLSEAVQYHATVGLNGSSSDPGWGLYGQALSAATERTDAFHQAGLKTMNYCETFGQTVTYIAEFPTETAQAGLIRPHAGFWSWKLYQGGPIHWIGIANYWDDEVFARPFTYSHPRYRAHRLTYPDGTPATGYTDTGNPPDPRTSRVLDASSSKDILGNLAFEYNPIEGAGDIDPATGKPVIPTTGLIPKDGKYIGHLSLGKDTACPFWNEYTYASTLMAVDNGMDGSWTDNFSPWDNFGYPPIKTAFGDWSVAGFRQFIKTAFTEEIRKSLTTADASDLDIRTVLRNQVKAWGGTDTNLDDPVWRDPRWVDLPVWRAFCIYKRQTGTAALKGYYDAMKRAASDAGKPDFYVAGNDIPFYSLGWPRGDLDAVSTELTLSWHMGTGARGIMPPPTGRMGPVYALAREHAKSRFVTIWMYVDPVYIGKPNIANVLEYEMLAHHALPKLQPSIPKIAGTPESNAAFFAFVNQARDRFGARIPVERIGVYYSSSSLLASMTPGGFLDMNAQPHAFAYYGWATALEELHCPYRAVPEWKLTPETLATLQVLIIPNAEVFEPAVINSVLLPWVNQGGHLIVTGNSGLRLGESGNFNINPNGLAFSELTGISNVAPAGHNIIRPVGKGKVVFLPDNCGMAYYLASDNRAMLLPVLAKNIQEVFTDTTIQGDSIPSTVGLHVFEDKNAGHFFIDLNNMDMNPATDQIRPTAPLQFKVNLPEWFKSGQEPALETISPESVEAHLTPVENGQWTLSVKPFSLYLSLFIHQ